MRKGWWAQRPFGVADPVLLAMENISNPYGHHIYVDAISGYMIIALLTLLHPAPISLFDAATPWSGSDMLVAESSDMRNTVRTIAPRRVRVSPFTETIMGLLVRSSPLAYVACPRPRRRHRMKRQCLGHDPAVRICSWPSISGRQRRSKQHPSAAKTRRCSLASSVFLGGPQQTSHVQTRFAFVTQELISKPFHDQ